MRVLYASNSHRGHGGGADYAARATAETARRHGLETKVYTRSSNDLPAGIRGRIEAGLSILHSPRSLRELEYLIDSFRPDIMHIHEIFPLISPWVLPLCTRHGIPAVMTPVDYRLTCPIVTQFRGGAICTECPRLGPYRALVNNCRGNLMESASVALYNTMARHFGFFHDHVRHFLSPSAFSKKWLVEQGGFDPVRITANFPIVEYPDSAADPTQGSYVAFAGRFTQDKGVHVFLEAARITGLPCKMARNVHASGEIEPQEGIEIVVTRDATELDVFYRGARAVVMPSIWFETFGLVAAEAMARGIPVIVSGFGALAELVEGGVGGLTFTPGNAAELAECMTRLWNDPALCLQLGASGRERARTMWQAEAHFDRMMDVYRALKGVPV